MNIFPTDHRPFFCAEALDDKRLVRQASEAVIILSSACHALGLPGPYGPHQLDHGLVQWMAADPVNWRWSYHYALACNLVYSRTFKRECESLQHMTPMLLAHKARFGVGSQCGETPATFHNAASNRALGLNFRGVANTIDAYRQYLNARWLLDKRAPTWKDRAMPTWRNT